MKVYFTLVALAQALLVLAHDHQVEPRNPPFGRGNGGGGYGGGYGRGGPFGWGGSGCARDCVSSYWETATPTPSAFCDDESPLRTCISSACASQADEYKSYSDRSSSLCSEYKSCESTGTYTYTYQTPDQDWPFGAGWRGTKTWPTGEVVVTGCPWEGNGWGFPFWGGLGGDGFWSSLGPGWEHTTVTTTVVQAGSTDQVYAVEQAVSDDVTTVRTIGLAAAATGSSSGDSSGASMVSVKVTGALLGAVLCVVGFM